MLTLVCRVFYSYSVRLKKEGVTWAIRRASGGLGGAGGRQPALAENIRPAPRAEFWECVYSGFVGGLRHSIGPYRI